MPRSKLTRERREQIVELMQNGTGFYDACKVVAGVSAETARRWARRGEADKEQGDTETEFALVSAAFAKLEEKRTTEARNVVDANIRGNGEMTDKDRDRQFKAAVWYLERKHPGEFGQQMQLHVQGRIQSLVEAVEDHMSGPAYGELLNAIAIVQGLDLSGKDRDEG